MLYGLPTRHVNLESESWFRHGLLNTWARPLQQGTGSSTSEQQQQWADQLTDWSGRVGAVRMSYSAHTWHSADQTKNVEDFSEREISVNRGNNLKAKIELGLLIISSI